MLFSALDALLENNNWSIDENEGSRPDIYYWTPGQVPPIEEARKELAELRQEIVKLRGWVDTLAQKRT